MAITVQPVDGLIHRLLQQNSRSEPAPRGGEAITRDHVSISSQARAQAAPESGEALEHRAGRSTPEAADERRGRALESHLLALYRSHDGIGG